MRPDDASVSGVEVTVALRMYGSVAGTVSKTEALTPKFCASIALGVWATQSSTMNVVPDASKFPGLRQIECE